MITRAEIIEIARHDPAVSMAVQMWRNGFCSWDQAMMAAVKALAHQKAEIIKHVMVIEQNRPFPPVFIPDPEKATPGRDSSPSEAAHR